MSPFGTMSTTIVVVLGRLSVVCVLVWVVVVLKEVVVGTISSEISHVSTSKELVLVLHQTISKRLFHTF